MISGFLLVNKPSGPTSHDVIYQLRKIIGIKQIGHAGTLDPFASGLLLVGIGEATKLLRHYVGLDKTYEAKLRLGAVSDTQDHTGKIQETRYKQDTITKLKIQKILKSFIGKQKQVPPMYSAKKVGGKKLYELARKGQIIKREPSVIEIYDIKLLSFNKDILKIHCRVSSGTYIRTLAHDIGQRLGCGAYLEELKRTAIGSFKLKDAVLLRHAELDSASNQKQIPKQVRDDGMKQARDDVLSRIIPLKTVLVSGAFDGVHPGHRNYFQQARKLGHRLVCIVGRDSVVERIKGTRPMRSEKERIKQVKACDEIDRVYLGIDGTDSEVYDFVASLRPDIIALGYDQKSYTDNLDQEMKKQGLDVEIMRMKAYHPEKYKSSILHKKTRA